MVDYIPTEKGTTIRQPSTANLMIDSKDRASQYPYPSNFVIQKNNSILNGYFTRIGVTEVVLDWAEPTIRGDSQCWFDISCNGVVTTNYELQFDDALWATSKEFCDRFVNLSIFPTPGVPIAGIHFVISNPSPGEVTITINNGVGPPAQFRPKKNTQGIDTVPPSKQIWNKFGILCPTRYPNNNVGWTNSISTFWVDPRAYSYIDIVSQELTYAQDLKDATTGSQDKNVLARFYLAWDDSAGPSYDAYGFPLLMGTRPFSQRKLYSPPKQIKWEPNLPIGNLSFQLATNEGIFVTEAENQNNQVAGFNPNNWTFYSGTNFKMTLQVSEV